jgi:hypothetical protein
LQLLNKSGIMEGGEKDDAAMAVSSKTMPAAKPKKTKETKSKGGGGVHYTKEEVELLLNCIARHMPVIGQAAWDAVMNSFNLLKDDGRRERDKGSVQRKFSELQERCTPTGNPNIASQAA